MPSTLRPNLRCNLVRLLLTSLLALAASLTPAAPAQADAIDDFSWVLSQLDEANANPFPISGSDVQASKGLFLCLEKASNDLAVIGCIDSFKNTPLGQEAASASGVPSWFWDLLDTYVALRANDFWGVVGHLGKAAICIVAQVMTGGSVDVCGLIEELVKLAESLSDAAQAVAKFVASIGKGAWSAVQDVGCSLGLGGCGSSSPPHERAYAWVFAPRVPDGVKAKKQVDAFAFVTLRMQLEANASAKPAKLSVQIPISQNYSAAAVSLASQIFESTVDAKWTADVAQNELPALAAKRGSYASPGQIEKIAQAAYTAFGQGNGPPSSWVPTRCTNDFKKVFGFAHVDRWITGHTDEAAKLGNVKSNPTWCQQVFWGQNLEPFAAEFQKLVAGICPTQSGKIVCLSMAAQKSCSELLGTVGLADRCNASGSVGLDAAKQIAAHLKKNGSKIPCTIGKTGLKIPGKLSPPGRLTCTRRPQQHYCKEAHEKLFGSLPHPVVSCLLDEDPAYTKLASQVKAAVASLAGGSLPQLGIDKIDPLVVLVGGEGNSSVQSQQDFGFGPPSKKKGFDAALHVPRLVDGVDTPVLARDLVGEIKDMTALQVRAPHGMPNPPDPTRPALLRDAISPHAGAKTKAGSAVLPRDANLSAQKMSPALGKSGASKPAGGFGKPVKMRNGELPPGQRVRVGKPQGARSAGAMPLPAIVPLELVIEPDLKIGSQRVRWGGTTRLESSEALLRSNGICEVPIRVRTRNKGSLPSGATSRRWRNSAVRGEAVFTTTPIAARAVASQVDTLRLVPGRNELLLTLGTQGQVAGGGARNNERRIVVEIEGSCGRAPAARVTPSRKRQALPAPVRKTAPTTRGRSPSSDETTPDAAAPAGGGRLAPVVSPRESRRH
ncbi:MAG: hypothetical protein GY937_00945 [bacterium]|nr:hypothetical protein [bacterium]